MKHYNYEGWKFLLTLQSKEILAELMDAKENGDAKLIIDDTGEGKTTAVKRFLEKNGRHTYVITIR